jgi:hypothetical protein
MVLRDPDPPEARGIGHFRESEELLVPVPTETLRRRERIHHREEAQVHGVRTAVAQISG